MNVNSNREALPYLKFPKEPVRPPIKLLSSDLNLLHCEHGTPQTSPPGPQNALDQLNPLYLAMAADSPYATTTVEKEVHAWLNRFMREAERGSQPLQRPGAPRAGKRFRSRDVLEPDL